MDHPSDRVDALDLAGDSLVAAAILSLIRHKVGDGHCWPAGEQFLKMLQLRVDARNLALVELDAPVRQPTCFRDGSVVAGQGCKGGELRRTVVQRHARMVLRGRMREVNDSITCIDTDSLTDTDSKFSASTDYYGFLDADESAWYGSQQQGVIKSVVQLGIMNGYTDGTFHPIGNITLSEAIKMAAVVHATCNNQTISFSASDGGKWYDAYLNYCVKNRIVSSDEYSSLDAYATRAQIAHIFAKATSDFAVVNDVDYDYIPDVSERSKYADEILALYRAGILTGDERTRAFRPSDTITRAEAAAIISRVALPTTRIKIV